MTLWSVFVVLTEAFSLNDFVLIVYLQLVCGDRSKVVVLEDVN